MFATLSPGQLRAFRFMQSAAANFPPDQPAKVNLNLSYDQVPCPSCGLHAIASNVKMVMEVEFLEKGHEEGNAAYTHPELGKGEVEEEVCGGQQAERCGGGAKRPRVGAF